MTAAQFLEKLKKDFDLSPVTGRYEPKKKHEAGMYLDGRWYSLTFRKGTFNAENPVEQLDVSILQNNLLGPILNIDDPRKAPALTLWAASAVSRSWNGLSMKAMALPLPFIQPQWMT